MGAKEIIQIGREKGLGKRNKPVYCEQTGEEWNSVKECSEDLGIEKYQIYANIGGSIKDIFGLTFKYGKKHV